MLFWWMEPLAGLHVLLVPALPLLRYKTEVSLLADHPAQPSFLAALRRSASPV